MSRPPSGWHHTGPRRKTVWPALLLIAALGCAAHREPVSTGPTDAEIEARLLSNLPPGAGGLNSLPGGRAAAIYNLAQERRRQGDRRGARILLTAAVRENPDLHPAYFELGEIYAEEENWAEAAAAYRRVLALKPGDVRSHLALGRIAEKTGAAERALFHYERAVELEPPTFLAHFRLGLIRQGRKQFGAAVHHLRRAVELRPDHKAARHWLWLSLAERGGADDWEVELGRRLMREGDETPVRFYQGRAARRFRAGRIDEALREIQKAVDVNPDWRDPRWRGVLADMARYRRARRKGGSRSEEIDRTKGR